MATEMETDASKDGASHSGAPGNVHETSFDLKPRTAVQAGGELNIFERYLTFWVACAIGAGIGLGRVFPGLAIALDAISVYQVSIPVAICLFFMMYPIMVKIDFAQAGKAARSPKPVILTLIVNWVIKPFTMVLFAQIGRAHV